LKIGIAGRKTVKTRETKHYQRWITFLFHTNIQALQLLTENLKKHVYKNITLFIKIVFIVFFNLIVT